MLEANWLPMKNLFFFAPPGGLENNNNGITKRSPWKIVYLKKTWFGGETGRVFCTYLSTPSFVRGSFQLGPRVKGTKVKVRSCRDHHN